MEKYTINYKGSKKLCSFYSGDLPITGKQKFNEDKNRLENIFSAKNIFVYDNSNYMFFTSKDEAIEFLQYIKRTIEENRVRYENVLTGSTDLLLAYANNLSIVTEYKPILNCNGEPIADNHDIVYLSR
jgi:hypothetical protein